MKLTAHHTPLRLPLAHRLGRLLLVVFLVAGLNGAALAQSEEPAAAGAEPPLTVNINADPALVLSDLLSGIGPAKAEAIVAYREENGPFESVDDLARVSGIGPATLEQLRPQLLLGDQDD